MLLKIQSRQLGIKPGFCSEPFIVKVFPEDVTPYAKRSPPRKYCNSEITLHNVAQNTYTH